MREKQIICTQWLPPLPTAWPQFAVVSGLALLRARLGASVSDRGVLLTSGAGPIPQGRMLSSMAAVPEDDRKIFVGNLAWRVSSEDLHSHFQQWGQIEDARVIMDRENPFRSRGFGFVTFSRAEDAQSAISMNHDKEWNGRNIRVNLASQPPPRRSE